MPKRMSLICLARRASGMAAVAIFAGSAAAHAPAVANTSAADIAFVLMGRASTWAGRSVRGPPDDGPLATAGRFHGSYPDFPDDLRPTTAVGLDEYIADCEINKHSVYSAAGRVEPFAGRDATHNDCGAGSRAEAPRCELGGLP
ncbi:MAG: hypothetical protein AMK72_10505 [Planctomycetes bacterium SM23_25]|nr:MAG: hypothetical protein AMK72_10505 [Planctomycetes bacterium SM23_25]